MTSVATKTPRQHRLDLWTAVAYEIGRTMTEQKWRITQEAFASLILGVIVWQAMQAGYPVIGMLGTFGIGTINTITAHQLYRAIREVQAENRDELVHDTGD